MKTCLVARLGVIGDCLVTASILPGLKAQGYHITFMAFKPISTILQNNPHIDVLREIEQDALGGPEDFKAFWKHIGPAYDRVIHLSESIERTLVYFEDQAQFWWDATARRALANVSYIERQHDLAGVPHEFGPVFFPTEAEDADATAMVEGWRPGKVVGLAVAGSGFDKMSPHIAPLAARLLALDPTLRLVLFAGQGKRDQALVETALTLCRKTVADGIDRVRHTIGWPIRKSLSVARKLDVVVGPDTGLMWGVAWEPVAKVVMLSHASAKNITSHWRDTVTLHAKPKDVPCWPCHRLHKEARTCRIDDATGAAKCIASIQPDDVIAAVQGFLQESI